MSRKLLSPLLFLTAGILVLISCKHRIEDLPVPGGGGNAGGGTGGGGTPCDSSKIYFQQQVLPIIVSNCALSGCHDVASHEGDVVLTSYDEVMRTGEIRPGRPFDSKLYEKITENDIRDLMPPPPRNPLSAQQILLIRKWIEQGAMNLSCDNMCDSNSFTFSSAIRPIISNKCQGCHSGSAPQGGIDLSTYTGVKARVTDGRLWGTINHLPGYWPMPKNGTKLSDCEISQFRKWIAAGALNN
jgi:hypothetical protein